MNRPIAVDLFAGCGGFSLGFEQAGFDVLAAIEIDPIHCATHQYNFPNCSVICRDITTITGAEIRNSSSIGNKEIDVVFGGSPCQGFSLIGLRDRQDSRNNLIQQFARVILELQPKYFVMENVKGLTIGTAKLLLSELIDYFELHNYKVIHPFRILNACNYGVPQSRERLFIIGCRGDLPLPNYPLPSQDKVTVWEGIADLPDVNQYEELLYQDWIITDCKEKSNYVKKLEDSETNYCYPRVYDSQIITCSMRTTHSINTIQRFLNTEPGKIEPISRFLKLHPEGLCNTLRAGTDRSRGSHTAPRPIHPSSPRVVSVREAARLHSYPDWFRFHVTKAHGFRQVGRVRL